MVIYNIENNIMVDEFKKILITSTLGKRRPIQDKEKLQKMLDFANIIITAREDDKLVGISRSLTDFGFCTYLSDLAVDKKYQKQGIGKELIKQTKLVAPDATLILLAAPEAYNYYEKIGMTQHEYAFYIKDINEMK